MMCALTYNFYTSFNPFLFVNPQFSSFFGYKFLLFCLCVCALKCFLCDQVTCVGVGDIFNSGSNAVVVLNAESQCHIFVISLNADKTSLVS